LKCFGCCFVVVFMSFVVFSLFFFRFGGTEFKYLKLFRAHFPFCLLRFVVGPPIPTNLSDCLVSPFFFVYAQIFDFFYQCVLLGEGFFRSFRKPFRLVPTPPPPLTITLLSFVFSVKGRDVVYPLFPARTVLYRIVRFAFRGRFVGPPQTCLSFFLIIVCQRWWHVGLYCDIVSCSAHGLLFFCVPDWCFLFLWCS